MGELYVGLMSGTSQDGVDAVLVDLDGDGCTVQASATTPYPDGLRDRVAAVIAEPRVSLRELGEVDVAIGRFFARCVRELIDLSPHQPADVVAIGHSGHTACHKPQPPDPFTMQLGDPSTVAADTGITTVADFRRMDMALGGQGAPLAPAFHEWRFSDPRETRVALNIGGIANLTLLEPGRPAIGFDTGPGNTLMDNWTRECTGEAYDNNGDWSRTGQIDESLLSQLKGDEYFQRPPPKSTGIEYFNLSWLRDGLSGSGLTIADEDVQATLTELTATTITDAIGSVTTDPDRLILCGGGAFNGALTERLADLMPGTKVESAAAHGVDPQWVEAVAFAWLARRRLKNEPGNLPTVTGAHQAAPLGGVYFGINRH